MSKEITPPCHTDIEGKPNCDCEIVNGEWITGIDPCNYCLEQKARFDLLFENDNEIFVCEVCGSEEVSEERIISYNINDKSKRLNRDFFSGYYCEECEDETKVITKK